MLIRWRYADDYNENGLWNLLTSRRDGCCERFQTSNSKTARAQRPTDHFDSQIPAWLSWLTCVTCFRLTIMASSLPTCGLHTVKTCTQILPVRDSSASCQLCIAHKAARKASHRQGTQHGLHIHSTSYTASRWTDHRERSQQWTTRKPWRFDRGREGTIGPGRYTICTLAEERCVSADAENASLSNPKVLRRVLKTSISLTKIWKVFGK